MELFSFFVSQEQAQVFMIEVHNANGESLSGMRHILIFHCVCAPQPETHFAGERNEENQTEFFGLIVDLMESEKFVYGRSSKCH